MAEVKKKVCLIVIDGWGVSESAGGKLRVEGFSPINHVHVLLHEPFLNNKRMFIIIN